MASLSTIPLFTAPTRATWWSVASTLMVFVASLWVLFTYCGVSFQALLAMFVAGLGSAAAEVLGATAKRLGMVRHILCSLCFYCAAWSVVFLFDWLLFDFRFMDWMNL